MYLLSRYVIQFYVHFLLYWHVQLCGFAVSLAGLYLYKQFKYEAPAPKAENILPLSSSDARIEWNKLNNNINTNAQTYKKFELASLDVSVDTKMPAEFDATSPSGATHLSVRSKQICV